MTHNHPTTEGLKVKIGGVYSYTNKNNYVSIFKVSRVTGKSIFVYTLLDGGIYSETESRIGVTDFLKYTFQPAETERQTA